MFPSPTIQSIDHPAKVGDPIGHGQQPSGRASRFEARGSAIGIGIVLFGHVFALPGRVRAAKSVADLRPDRWVPRTACLPVFLATLADKQPVPPQTARADRAQALSSYFVASLLRLEQSLLNSVAITDKRNGLYAQDSAA